jgi:hypothetical protein
VTPSYLLLVPPLADIIIAKRRTRAWRLKKLLVLALLLFLRPLGEKEL